MQDAIRRWNNRQLVSSLTKWRERCHDMLEVLNLPANSRSRPSPNPALPSSKHYTLDMGPFSLLIEELRQGSYSACARS